MRLFFIWLLLFGSKIVILEAVDLIFGEHVELGGFFPFMAVALTLLLSERLLTLVYGRLHG